MFNIFFCKSFINKLLTKNIYKLQNILKYNDSWNVSNYTNTSLLQKFSYNRYFHPFSN